MLKGIMNAAKNYVTKYDGGTRQSGVIQNDSEFTIITCRRHGIVRYYKLNDTERAAFDCIDVKKYGKQSSKTSELFSLYQSQPNLYPSAYIVELNIAELAREVQRKKHNLVEGLAASKSAVDGYRFHGWIEDNKFGVCFDEKLLLDTARCLDTKAVSVAFPSQEKNPIFLFGKYGDGCVAPLVRCY